MTHADLQRLDTAIKENELNGSLFDYIIFRGDMKDLPMVNGKDISGALTLKKVDEKCIFLGERKCTIWRHRPLSCRLYPFNPIFYEKETGFTMDIEESDCPNLLQNTEQTNNLKKIALQWRKERLEYDTIVRNWNNRTHGDLIQFIRGLAFGGAFIGNDSST